MASQNAHLLWLLLNLKSGRIAWVIPVVLAVFSHFALFFIINFNMGIASRTVDSVDANIFAENSVILVDDTAHMEPVNALLGTLIYRESVSLKAVKNLLVACYTDSKCWESIFRILYGKSYAGKHPGYIQYMGETEPPKVICQMQDRAVLYCPFLMHLASSSFNVVMYNKGQTFGRASFLSIIVPASQMHDTKPIGTCASHGNFNKAIRSTVFVQSLLLICSGWLYFLLCPVWCMADLKKNGFLIYMFKKGLSVSSYWSAVWLISAVESLLPALLLVISHTLMCVGYHFTSSILAIFLVAFTQFLGMAAVAFLLTVLFQKFFFIGLALAVITIGSCAVAVINHVVTPTDANWVKPLLLMLGPFGHLGQFMEAHLSRTIVRESVTAYHHLIMVESILFPPLVAGLTIYLDFILSTGNGYQLPPGYVLDKRFWAPELVVPTDENLGGILEPDSPNIEPMKEGLRPIIRMQNLCKSYVKRSGCFTKNSAKSVVALDDISGCIYENQITVIVGHNGSGKSALLNILSGSEILTNGQVFVDGFVIRDPMCRMKLHKMVDHCTQEGFLCSTLTVMQTLELACVSCPGLAVAENVLEDLIQAVRLNVNKNICVGKLSSGMRRKLCILVALIGDAKILILDEPFKGIDPLSRRLIWKLLQGCRSNRTIIMSSQAMDEADALADRNLLLSGGVLICAGSSVFLKSVFDCGFDFNVMLKARTHAPLLIKQIQQEFSQVRVKSQFLNNLRFRLPAQNLKELPMLAQAFERRQDWIAEFGLLHVSLYDIFLRLKDFSPTEIKDLFRMGKIDLLFDYEEAVEVASDPCKSKKRRLETLLASNEKKLTRSNVQSFRALIRVNILRILRSKVRLAGRIGAPLVLLVILIVLAAVEKKAGNSRLPISNNLTVNRDSFEGGVCLFPSDSRPDTITAESCSNVLSGRPAVSNGSFLSLTIPAGLSDHKALTKYLLQFKEPIKATCHAMIQSTTGCPFVFATDWEKSLPNSDRKVSVGSFTTSGSFKSSQTASILIQAYKRLFDYFLLEGNQSINAAAALRIQVESILEFRSVFVNLYGTFVQLVIVSIMPSTFLDDLLEDRATKVKSKLTSIGMSGIRYWLFIYFVHYAQYAVIYLLSVILIVAIHPSCYANSFYLAGIVLPTLLFGLSNNQLTMYIASTVLSKSSIMVTVASFFLSAFLVLIVVTVQLDNLLGITLIALLPPFSTISLTFHGTKAIFYTVSFLRVKDVTSVQRAAETIYFYQPHIIASFASIIVHFFILPAILCVLVNRDILVGRCKKVNILEVEAAHLDCDPDIQDEVRSIEDGPRRESNRLELRHVNMTFSNGTKALKDISFAVEPGEIFGLLGPNGAGKSTTMAIIVGELRASSGRCEINSGKGWKSSRLASKRGSIGFCPQYDPLYPDLTAREHLQFFASIMGLSKEDADEQIDLLLEGLELDEHNNEVISKLSYANKRRLSLAASLLGNPCLLVIDEAATGVDLEDKRFLWQAIKSVATEKRSIIIATNSMEEAEVLASRVGILNCGCLIGLGTAQHLKNRFGQYYTLELLFAVDNEPAAEEVELRKTLAITAVCSKFANSTITDEFTDRIAFAIPRNSIIRLSLALSWLADMQQTWKLAYFALHQMSLDHTFIRIVARHNNQLNGIRDSTGSLNDGSCQSILLSIRSKQSESVD